MPVSVQWTRKSAPCSPREHLKSPKSTLRPRRGCQCNDNYLRARFQAKMHQRSRRQSDLEPKCLDAVQESTTSSQIARTLHTRAGFRGQNARMLRPTAFCSAKNANSSIFHDAHAHRTWEEFAGTLHSRAAELMRARSTRRNKFCYHHTAGGPSNCFGKQTPLSSIQAAVAVLGMLGLCLEQGFRDVGAERVGTMKG